MGSCHISTVRKSVYYTYQKYTRKLGRTSLYTLQPALMSGVLFFLLPSSFCLITCDTPFQKPQISLSEMINSHIFPVSSIFLWTILKWQKVCPFEHEYQPAYCFTVYPNWLEDTHGFHLAISQTWLKLGRFLCKGQIQNTDEDRG